MLYLSACSNRKPRRSVFGAAPAANAVAIRRFQFHQFFSLMAAR
jgi:hypothetical protein